MAQGLNPSGLPVLMYQAVRDAGIAGVPFAVLRKAFPDRTVERLQNTLYALRLSNFIRHNADRRVYLVDQSCAVPVIRYSSSPRTVLLGLITDCPAGISAAFLEAESRLSEAKQRRLLAHDIVCGRVRQITLPARHGGGPGFQLSEGGAA